MNAREEIREHLIAERMRHWLTRAKYSFVGNGCPKWRARKNYWALVKRYPDLAKRLGLNPRSVF